MSIPNRDTQTLPGRSPAVSIALLLSLSGFCALVYQIVWFRELRLVFGASTAASAAVLAIFMGGLGLGGALLGPRADRVRSPLGLYAVLEVLIACSAALTPFLLDAVRQLYIQTGGSMALGTAQATLFRLIFAALVLAIPTLLMGGTLPAAVRAAETSHDTGRVSVALLYGANTLGAVLGASLSTFVLLELYGIRKTLWLAALGNLLVALAARAYARTLPMREARGETPRTEATLPAARAAAPAWIVYAAAGAVGFAFFLMELVWYRMLGPLLGGSTYTFGLILAIALLGIGIGGALYAWGGARRAPTAEGFAFTVALEALLIAAPFAAGDRIAVLAQALRDLSAFGFYGHVTGWSLVTALVVFPAAVIAGYQFPMLIALLGRGDEQVGRQTGFSYAFNTLGAILASLAGGFIVLPYLGAPGAWRAVIVVLSVLAAAFVVTGIRSEGGRSARRAYVPIAIVVAAVALITIPSGPTAVWRHSGIGVGQPHLQLGSTNELTQSMLDRRRTLLWEQDGIESSVGIEAISGLGFIINGKTDGNARFDASTQVTLGLIGALVHPEPKRSFVIGLGTGSTAGWLGAVETMERVDVAEFEPAILEVARLCADVNHDMLNDAKVIVRNGDARELLLTAPGGYDLIVSEPSNPYRAGIASLYTVEFYQAVADRLSEGGIFSQWVQAYEIDAATFRTILATLASVFPHVEVWQTNPLDLVILCAEAPLVYDVQAMAVRLNAEPFRSGFLHAWGVVDVEGIFAHYVANGALAREVAEQEAGRLNTDDQMRVEYGFARTVGIDQPFSANDLRNSAYALGHLRPEHLNGTVDWINAEEQRMHMAALQEHVLGAMEGFPDDHRRRGWALSHFVQDDIARVWDEWSLQLKSARYPVEVAMVAESLAERGDSGAVAYAERLRAWWPIAADAVLARLAARQGRLDEAVEKLEVVFIALRSDPWPISLPMERSLKLAQEIAAQDVAHAPRLIAALEQPFSTRVYEALRMLRLVELASTVGPEAAVPHLERYEPNPIWTREFLSYRALCYARTGHALAEQAQRDLKRFDTYAPKRFADTHRRE